MRPHRVRQICRSPNPFTPSIALWQHFVLPHHLLHQQRSSSSTAGTVESGANAESDTDIPFPPPVTSAEYSGPEPTETKDGAVPIRFTVDTKGSRMYGTPTLASIQNNMAVKAERIKREADLALLRAKTALDTYEDYEGVVVQPMQHTNPAMERDLPWIPRPSERRNLGGHERLVKEIENFQACMKPNKNEVLARRHLIEQVRTHAREVLPDHVLEVFGSERTGLAMATSDIDLRLVKRAEAARVSRTWEAKLPPTHRERKWMVNALYYLHQKRFSKNKDYILATIRHARYPLIALQDRKSGLDVQIVLSNDTSKSRDLIRQYMEEYPHLQQLYFVVKTIFDVRGLSDVFRGGFGSYSIFMMIVASLRHGGNVGKRDVADALLDFLRFWRDFDNETTGISIEPPLLFKKSEELVMTEHTKQQLLQGKQKPLPKYMLCLRDPADDTNDLGRKGACIKHVKATLGHLAFRLQDDVKFNSRQSLLASLVGPIYSLNEGRRLKLELQGRNILKELQGTVAATAMNIRTRQLRGVEPQAQEKVDKAQQKVDTAQPGHSRADGYGEALASKLGMPSV